MLFNSYEFLFVFLPIVLVGFHGFCIRGHARLATGWLALASLFFYGWWDPRYLLLLGASIAMNFMIGKWLSRSHERAPGRGRRLVLVLGVGGNLAAIAYFKYAGFLVGTIDALAGTNFAIGPIVLPLAISFFTFQQIAYLVDTYRGVTAESDLLRYTLFVSFFPQLIAGPIVHHAEMMPQFRARGPGIRLRELHVGLSIFAVGLAKKAVLADGIAVYATPVFAAADQGETLTFFAAWGGALAYTFQLYFDFSGYSDMAIGAARMCGIRLPLNFHSPYKAQSIIDFWRRWHMTLSRFLRDYLYIPLGGSRRGQARRYANMMITMVLGGLWHGAGWTFVAWGALHGAYLTINQLWRVAARRAGWHAPRGRGRVIGILSWALTFLAVVVGWVFFRATTFNGALAMLEGMLGWNGVSLPQAIAVRVGAWRAVIEGLGVDFTPGGGSVFMATWIWIAALSFVSLVLPNTQQLFGISGPDRRDPYQSPPAFRSWTVTWRHSVWASAAGGVLLALGVLALPRVSEFLYFQF